MPDRYFIDTNIIIYSYCQDDPQKRNIAVNLLSSISNISQLNISYQVLNEFCNFLYKTIKDWELISNYYDEIIRSFTCHKLEIPMYNNALYLCQKYKYSWYDSLILAAALDIGCNVLISEDFQNNQLIENSLLIVNPLK